MIFINSNNKFYIKLTKKNLFLKKQIKSISMEYRIKKIRWEG
jgi:hypothetical protein